MMQNEYIKCLLFFVVTDGIALDGMSFNPLPDSMRLLCETAKLFVQIQVLYHMMTGNQFFKT